MMQSPFMQHVEDLFSKLTGRSLVIAGVVWGVLLIVALSCVFGVIQVPGFARAPDPTATATATPQPTDPMVPEAADTTEPGVTITPTGSLTLPTPTPTPELPEGWDNMPPLPWGDFGYGIASHAIVLPDHTMRQIRDQLGLQWVKQQVRWDHFSKEPGQMDWSAYDAMVFLANEYGIKVMLSVVGAPDWSRSFSSASQGAAPPDDMGLFVEFIGDLVDRYEGRIHAIEVWNEQNLDREWDTEEGVSAEQYTEMLRLSYQAIKSRDPNIIVISGALSPTGVTATDPVNPNRYVVMDDFLYFQQMVDAGFLNYADCVGVHHNGYNIPPWVEWDEGYNDPTATFRGPFDSPHHSWSFKSTLWGYHEMIQAAGRNTPLCVTEFGWATSEGFDGTPRGFEFADDNTLEEQAEWDVEAFRLMREWGFVHLAFLWNLDYSHKAGIGAEDPNAPYAILDLVGAARPAFDAIARMPKVP